MLSCWVCLVHRTKIRCTGQFRPGFFLVLCATVKVNPSPKSLGGNRNNRWRELDFAQRAPAWLTHSAIKSKCWQLALISHNCCGLVTEKWANGKAKYRERVKQRQSWKWGWRMELFFSDVTWDYICAIAAICFLSDWLLSFVTESDLKSRRPKRTTETLRTFRGSERVIMILKSYRSVMVRGKQHCPVCIALL